MAESKRVYSLPDDAVWFSECGGLSVLGWCI